ncbi:GntR family transcriptional regulator [Devosia algicola]|uniref:GntR family transcriptional regulator n=1 Tax=Devosia algicola TaxID=3026418 RepID=A0ABY7YLR6_9HYPH|nr:GntR family transcriptional regulator [Devosia algicola]WDR02035.1 GntR family transcriptional regulator [Devosia algicola]
MTDKAQPSIDHVGSQFGGDETYLFNRSSGSIASQVYDYLMQRILDMKLEPFQELSEARLATEFGVSRTPVREALARLARRGLVDILPQRGTRVSPLSEEPDRQVALYPRGAGATAGAHGSGKVDAGNCRADAARNCAAKDLCQPE